MNEQVFIQVRVEEELKNEANDILEALGISMPVAIRMFLKRIVLEQGLPFDVTLPQIKEAEPKKKTSVVYIPAIPAKEISAQEYADIVKSVPAGKVTRDDDIEAYLCKKYGAKRVEFQRPFLFEDEKGEMIPYWRVLTTRGMLAEHRMCSKERQEMLLKEEGHHIVSCGAGGRSLKVENYQQALYKFL